MSQEGERSGSYRPIRRIRQACDACRRRKSRCSGERPVCSYCARFRRQCRYSLDHVVVPTRGSFGSAEQSRLDELEGRLQSVLNAMSNKGQHDQAVVSPGNSSTCSRIVESPQSPPEQGADHSEWRQAVSLPKEEVECAARRFLSQADYLSALVFLQDCPCDDMQDEDLLYSVFGLAAMFSDESDLRHAGSECRNSAFPIVTKRISTGTVQATTLQALCVLSYTEFACGMVDRAEILASMAINICETAGITVDGRLNLALNLSEKLQGCFWSLYLLQKMHSCGRGNLSLTTVGSDSYDFSFAKTIPRPLNGPDNSGPQGNYISNLTPGHHSQPPDHGIMAYAARLADIWATTLKLCLDRSGVDTLPPWAPNSTFVTITSLLVELETSMSPQHRFHFARFADRSLSELRQHPSYWGLFLFIQFTYHTIFCLLNHPILLSMKLRKASVAAPYSFNQACTEQLRVHSDWVVHFIDMLAEKDVAVTNPFLGYSALVVASGCLPQIHGIGHEPIQRLQNKFNKCVEFAQGLSRKWPNLCHMMNILRRMQSPEAVDSPNSAPPDSSCGLASLLLKLIDYKSASRAPQSMAAIIGTSLRTELRRQPTCPPADSTVATDAVMHASESRRGGIAAAAAPVASRLQSGAAATEATLAFPHPMGGDIREAETGAARSMADRTDDMFNGMPLTVEMSDDSLWPMSGLDPSGSWWSMGSL